MKSQLSAIFLSFALFTMTFKPTLAANSYKDFLVSFWVGPTPEFVNVDTYQKIKDANFTNCGLTWYYTVATNKKMLDICNSLGMTAFVVDDRIAPDLYSRRDWKSRIAQVVAEYSSYPNLISYYVMDEPGARLFTGLGEISKHFTELDPNRLPYVNLFPDYASTDQLEAINYKSYVELFSRTVKPEILSYDYYTFIHTEENGSYERKTYFQNLAVLSNQSQVTGKPFWNTILTWDHLFYRRPTLGEMRWQVHTSLAYGANGIMHFTYWWEPRMNPVKNAVVDAQGNPTDLYPIVQEANLEAINTAHQLEDYTFGAAYQSAPIPQGTKAIPGDFPLQLIGQASAVVASFQTASSPAWMIVNRDFKANQLLKFTSAQNSLEYFDSAQNIWQSLEADSTGVFTLNLAPGYAALIRPRI